jgi:hypothetical protein
MAASWAPKLSNISFSRPGILPIFGGCPSPWTIPAITMLAMATATVLLAVERWQVGEIGFLVGGCLVGHFLFPNDEVQRDNKDDEGDSDWEPPVVFAREVNTRAVNLNNGNGSVVDLDCCDGKKCRDSDDSGTEEVLISNFI